MPISRAGYERLRKELDFLIREERPKAIKAIEIARGHGDLTDNAEFQVAKEQQALLEGKIKDLQGKLAESQILPYPTGPLEKAVFGSLVLVEDLRTGERNAYELVGPYESDTKRGLVSVLSPLGKALIGKREGDQVTIETPGGVRKMEIIKVGIGGPGGHPSP